MKDSTIDEFIWPNRYMLTFLGFWPMETEITTIFKLFAFLRMIISIFIMSTLFLPEIYTIKNHWDDIFILAEAGLIARESGQLIFKLLYMVVRHKKFYKIYNNINKLWVITNNKNERGSFEKFARIAKKFTIIFFVAAISNIFTFVVGSIISSTSNYTRHLPLDIRYGIDTQRSPYYEVAFISQTIAMVFGATGVVGFDATMMTLILHISGQLRFIRNRLFMVGHQIVKKIDLKYVQKEIGRCILHHQWVIRVVKEINFLLGPVIFVQLMTSGLNICLSGYALMVASELSNRTEITKFLVYIFTMFIQLVIWCGPGQLLIQESTTIGQVVYYEFPWYLLSPKQRRDLSFFILRTQKECQVTALDFHVMSLRKLTDVFNTAGSYLALLRGIYDK